MALAPAAFAVDFTPATTSPEPAGVAPFGVTVADLDANGTDDLAVAGSSSVGILLGDGSGNFTPAATSPETAANGARSTAVADFNADGKLDLAVAGSTSNQVTILLGAGNGDFTAAPTSPEMAGGQPRSVAAGDFNADGKPDLAVANGLATNLTILLGAGDGDFTAAPTSPEPVGSTPDTVVVGEFNADGKPDLAVSRAGFDNVTILLGAAGGDFAAAPTSPEGAGDTPRQVITGEFNGDAQPDLAIANQVSNNVTVLLGAAGGDFAAAPTSPEASGATSSSLVTADFDQNGTADLAVGNQVPDTVTVLIGAGTGDFNLSPNPAEAGGNNPQAIAQGDFNRDGVPDLAVADADMGSVTVLLGVTHQLVVVSPGTGSGYVDSSPAGIDCGLEIAGHTDCSNTYADGAPVTLTAHPEQGTRFDGFTSGGCTGGPGLTCTVIMDTTHGVNATFTDIVAPETKITKRPKRRSTKRRARLEFTSSEPSSKFTCQLDQGPKKPCKRQGRYTAVLKPGKHVFSVFATDDAGNADTTPAKARWRVLE